MKIRFHIITGCLFVLAGVLIGSQFYTPSIGAESKKLVPTPVAHVSPETISGEPSHISVPSLRISTDIIPGYYNKVDSSWTLSTTKAMYATLTAKPNSQSGNTYIYAHARTGLFANLANAKKGTEVVVTTANGHEFTYLYSYAHDVNPSDTSVLNPTNKPQLTLQTCSGIWSENRYLVVFHLVGVK
ncbi:MAG: sortase [Patescibacteria group bacterium]|nr:sortase [Patescibacteria group bacterium]